MGIFKIEKLTYFYPGAAEPALKDIDLAIREGEVLFIAGNSGCGKTTLAKAIAGIIPGFYGGKIKGRVLFKNKSLFEENKKDVRREIGMVFQEPEKQLVMQKVESELAFGLENLGMTLSEIKRRVVEAADFFGLEKLLDREVGSLSSGEKQKTVLASVLAMGVKVIVLDEPVSCLDPAAEEEVFQILRRLKDKLGHTIILVEQKIEKYLELADRAIFLEGGEVVKDLSPCDFVKWAGEEKKDYLSPRRCNVLRENCDSEQSNFPGQKKNAIEAGNVSFLYDNTKQAVLKNINFSIEENNFVCILGENGAGKTTLLKLMMGFLKPSDGKISVFGRDILSLSGSEKAKTAGYLSQNPDSYFLNDTLEKELKFTLDNLGKKDDGVIEEVLRFLRLEKHRHKNPRDLSVGEKERAALASVMAGRPKILLLDEPTRGLDYSLKRQLGGMLGDFIKRNSGTVVVVTQDVDFAAEFAEKIILFAKGEIIGCGDKREILMRL